MQWPSDLIGYDALNSYGSPSYYAQKMFNNYLGDVIVPVEESGIPTIIPPPARAGGAAPAPLEQIYSSVTRDSKTGVIYMKVVNVTGTAQPVQIDVKGVERD